MDVFLATLRSFPYGARGSDVFHFSQLVYTMARHTLMETCGTQFWGRSWNASSALAPTVFRTANASRVPPTTHASILWNQQESAARPVQVVKRSGRRDKPLMTGYVNVIHATFLCFCLQRVKRNVTRPSVMLHIKITAWCIRWNRPWKLTLPTQSGSLLLKDKVQLRLTCKYGRLWKVGHLLREDNNGTSTC